jgi:hypothetical protein
MRLRIPNGISDFRELGEQKFEYLDKSHMISEFIDRDGHKVILCRVLDGLARRST